MGNAVQHRTKTYLNDCLARSPSIKQRYYPRRGFGTFTLVTRFYCAFDELRHYFYFGSAKERVFLSRQRRPFCERLVVLQALMKAVSSSTHLLSREIEQTPAHLRVLNSDTLPSLTNEGFRQRLSYRKRSFLSFSKREHRAKRKDDI